VNFLRNATEYLLGGPKVGGASEARLRRWMSLPEQELALPHARARYVVVDTETAGGDARRDRMTAIGAVGVARAGIDLADCFTTVLRQAPAGADAGTRVEGTGGRAQPDGIEPALGVLDFLDYLGKAPVVAFDAGVERKVVERAMQSILGVAFRQPWIDLAVLLPALFPDARCTTRAEWFDRFGLAAGAWHDVLGDAFVTAQLFLAALEAANRAGMVNAAQLVAHRRAAR
jgi:DNA polymerase-3 subunit epsilon